MIIIPIHSDSPPPMNGCDYTVKVDPGTWRCMTEQEYWESFDSHSPVLPTWIGLPLLFVLGIVLVGFVGRFVWSKCVDLWRYFNFPSSK